MKWLAIALLIVPSARAVTLRHGNLPDAGANLAESFPGTVVRIQVQSAGGPERTASGVALGPDWVLTAAHAVAGATADNVSLSNGASARLVDNIHFHPDWDTSPVTGLTQGADLALLHLVSPISTAMVPPLWASTASFVPTPAFLAGYGDGGNGLLGAYLPGGTLQAAYNTADRYATTPNGALWITDFDSGASAHNSLNLDTTDLRHYNSGFSNPRLTDLLFPPGEANTSLLGPQDHPMELEGTTSRGDSGGPLFLYDQHEARWELAGITSFGVNPLLAEGFTRYDSRYGDLSFFADVSAQRAWLDSVLIPEPSSALYLASILVPLFLRRQPQR